MSNAELIAAGHVWPGNKPGDLLIRALADALEEADAKLEHIQSLVPVGVAEHDKMYDALMAINKVYWPNA